MAPQAGLEPATYRLTAECSTAELLRHILSCLALGCQPIIGLIPLVLHTQDLAVLGDQPHALPLSY